MAFRWKLRGCFKMHFKNYFSLRRKTVLSRIIFAALIFGTLAFAQDSVKTLVDLMRQDLKATKMEILKKEMNFSEADAEKFWPIYENYSKELKKIGDRELNLIKQYVKFYENMTDPTAKTVFDESIRIKQARLDLEKEYFEVVSKALSPKVAAKFTHIESMITQMIRLQIYSELPVLR